jgi:putative ABC transport system permease protein
MSQTLLAPLRAIAAQRGFSLVVVLTMALCIGSNAAIWSGARAVLFRPLPYPDAERMVILDMHDPTANGEVDLSWSDALDWSRRSHRIQQVSPFLCWQDRLIMHRDAVERINVNFVPSTYFDLLGARPQLGRVFSAAMDGAPGTAPYVVLTDKLWRQSFAADPGVVGKPVRLNSRTFTVLGVMPRGFFDFVQGRVPCDAWIPANMAADAFLPGVQLFSRDENDWFAAARLAPGASLASARQEAEVVVAQLRREFPDTDKNYYPRLTPLREWMFGDLYPGMKLLLLGGLLVLLIGCANVAGLLLVQLARRRGEIAARLAGGAGRGQLAWQLLAESLLLTLAGGALGLLFAEWGARRLAGLLDLAPYTRVEIDGVVLAVALLATVVAGCLCGLPAALAVARQRPEGAAARGAPTTATTGPAAPRRRAARVLAGWLVFEIAVVTVLLIAGSLLVRSLWLLQGRSVGFDTAHLLTLRMSYKSEEYKDLTKVSAAMAAILGRLDALPGVAGAAVWGPEVPGVVTQFTEVLRDGQPATAETTRAELHLISPGSLALLRLPLLRGREFAPTDTRDRPRVALVSQALAEALWPGKDPLGRLLYRPDREHNARVVVVGVIPNAMLQGRFVEGSRHILFPSTQLPPTDGYLLVRSGADPAALAGAVVSAVRQVDSQIPVYDARTLDDRLRQQEKPQRLNATVVGGYALLALVLAVVGVYGTLLYGLLLRLEGTSAGGADGADGADGAGGASEADSARGADGADRDAAAAAAARHRASVRHVLTRGALLVAAGLVLGLLAALAVTRLLANLLYGVTATDPLIFAGAAVVLGVALLATALVVGQGARAPGAGSRPA